LRAFSGSQKVLSKSLIVVFGSPEMLWRSLTDVFGSKKVLSKPLIDVLGRQKVLSKTLRAFDEGRKMRWKLRMERFGSRQKRAAAGTAVSAAGHTGRTRGARNLDRLPNPSAAGFMRTTITDRPKFIEWVRFYIHQRFLSIDRGLNDNLW
jgi:hypothetical protein